MVKYAILEKVLNPLLRQKICKPADLFHQIKDGMVLGLSGFTPSGYPKTFPIEFSKFVKHNGMKVECTVLSGASIGCNTENALADAGITKKRYPYQSGLILTEKINKLEVEYADLHLANYTHQIRHGFFGDVDVAIIEVSEITEDGHLVLAGSVGNVPELVLMADKIILEVNCLIPSFFGIHDIISVNPPPSTGIEFEVSRVSERIGVPYVQIDPEKVIGVIPGDIPDDPLPLKKPNGDEKRIAQHIFEFIDGEIERGALSKEYLPNFQSGVGNIANAVLGGLIHTDLENLDIWTEVVQDSVLDLIDKGKVLNVSGTALTFSEEYNKRFFDNFNDYLRIITLRPSFISNGRSIRRLGVIAMNTPVEIDFYGHANSTHVLGSRCIMPMVSHVDHSEHDIHIVVTEQGLADLRGLDPVGRAREIIKNCAHPDYKDQLEDYLEEAICVGIEKGMAHEPQMLNKVFKMYTNFMENGTMKLENWD